MLLGGWEHTKGCECIDELVTEMLGVRSPRVAITPVASTLKMLPVAIDRAKNYWKRLDGTVAVALPRREDPRPALEALAGADIIVLTGGLADRIGPVLLETGMWDRILDLWRCGSAVVGSSRGLMELFERRWCLRAPRPFQLIQGLGLFGGYIAVPHFNRYWFERWAPRMGPALQSEGLGLLGLDERTALVGGETGFSVTGMGYARVVVGTSQSVHAPGARVTLGGLVTTSRLGPPGDGTAPLTSKRGLHLLNN